MNSNTKSKLIEGGEAKERAVVYQGTIEILCEVGYSLSLLSKGEKV